MGRHAGVLARGGPTMARKGWWIMLDENGFPIVERDYTCPCGSGEPAEELLDAHGIYCGKMCSRCETDKRSEFDPRIFEGPYEADEPIEPDEGYFDGDEYWPGESW